MPPVRARLGARRVGLAPWTPGAGHDDLRSYVEKRLALFCKLILWNFVVLMVFVSVLYELHPDSRPARVEVVHYTVYLGGAVLLAWWMAAVWKRERSIEFLYAMDTLYTIAAGFALGLSAYFQSDERAAAWSAFIWEVFLVMGRAIVLPSSARRTAIVSSLSFVPMALASVGMAVWFPEHLELPAPAFVFGTLLFIVVAIVLATTGSRVIYGLRRQISEALQLGQYVLDEKIGEGGMGTVHRARHALLRRPTAIKLLPPDKLGAESLRRFEREVQHMSRLSHPNSVVIFDYGHSDGVFYYAMELIDGIDLERLVRRFGPQPPERVIHLLRQACAALDEAHSMGLTHRDIKPQNIMVCRRGRTPDVVKVLDFGLVKELTQERERSVTKVIAGTPAYMAPEQVVDPERVGPATDLYALGAVGYFLLTGQRVFDGKTDIDVCTKHVTAAPVPPSQRLERPLPAELEALILACLEKDPARRPASALAMRQSLSRMEAYRGWDDAAWVTWWEAFEAQRAAAGRPAVGGDDAAVPVTITVDLRDREAVRQIEEQLKRSVEGR